MPVAVVLVAAVPVAAVSAAAVPVAAVPAASVPVAVVLAAAVVAVAVVSVAVQSLRFSVSLISFRLLLLKHVSQTSNRGSALVKGYIQSLVDLKKLITLM